MSVPKSQPPTLQPQLCRKPPPGQPCPASLGREAPARVAPADAAPGLALQLPDGLNTRDNTGSGQPLQPQPCLPSSAKAAETKVPGPLQPGWGGL